MCLFSKPTVTVVRSESLNEKTEPRTSVRRARRYDCCIVLTDEFGSVAVLWSASVARMYINILLDTVLATDVDKYSLASATCHQRWQTKLGN